MEKKFKAQEKRARRVERKNASENPEVVVDNLDSVDDVDAVDDNDVVSEETVREENS
jgi:hypothetical protein